MAEYFFLRVCQLVSGRKAFAAIVTPSGSPNGAWAFEQICQIFGHNLPKNLGRGSQIFGQGQLQSLVSPVSDGVGERSGYLALGKFCVESFYNTFRIVLNTQELQKSIRL